MPHEFKHLLPTFPADAAQHLIDYLMGVETDLCCVLDCSTGLLRYGGYLLATGACPHASTAAIGTLSTADKIDLLKPLTKQPVAGAPDPVGINWSAIVLLVMQILQELMQQPVPLHTTRKA